MTEIIGFGMVALLFLAIYFAMAWLSGFKATTVIFLITGIVVVYIYIAASLIAGTP